MPVAALRLIGSRDFGPYFVGNALSASGGWFQNLAGALLIYRLTHSPFLLGVLNVAQFAPVLLLAPWTGVVADRFDRRRIVLVTQLGAAASSAPVRRAASLRASSAARSASVAASAARLSWCRWVRISVRLRV